ncbi:MAG: DUF3127 domain-containing protein [Bacteroidota bacterium]
MSYEISGRLIEKYNVVTISDKFKKREFVLEKKENSNGFEFIDYIKFQLIQDKCAILDPFQIGDELKVNFNLRGRKWEKEGKVNYFTNLEAWKIDKINLDQSPTATDQTSFNNQAPMPDEEDFSSSGETQEFDDLPF